MIGGQTCFGEARERDPGIHVAGGNSRGGNEE